MQGKLSAFKKQTMFIMLPCGCICDEWSMFVLRCSPNCIAEIVDNIFDDVDVDDFVSVVVGNSTIHEYVGGLPNPVSEITEIVDNIFNDVDVDDFVSVVVGYSTIHEYVFE